SNPAAPTKNKKTGPRGPFFIFAGLAIDRLRVAAKLWRLRLLASQSDGGLPSAPIDSIRQHAPHGVDKVPFGDEQIDESGLKLFPALLLDVSKNIFLGPRFFVASLAAERVHDVGQRGDPSANR